MLERDRVSVDDDGPGERVMAREVDLRTEDDYVSFVLRAEDLPFGAQDRAGSLIDRALTVARLTTEVFGAQQVEPIEFRPDQTAAVGRRGGASVHLQQELRGIPVFMGNQVVRFGRFEDVQRTQGRLAVGPAAEADVFVDADVAAEAAVRHLATEPLEDPHPDALPVELGAFVGRILGQFVDLPTRPTVLDAGPLDEPVQASLTWLPLGGSLRLCWDMTIAVSALEGGYRVLVGADTPDVCYAVQLVPGACTGTVYPVDPSSDRQEVEFPRPWTVYGSLVDPKTIDIQSKPSAWVAIDATEGYAARASVGANTPPIASDGAGGVVRFAPVDVTGPEQAALNAFYGVCSVHDLLYLLGFREAEGCYQDGAVSAAGRPTTRVNVEVRKDPVMGTAHWWALSRVPAMRLGPDADTGRSTALDMTIVVHEYMHGVTLRLVGGGSTANPFVEPQSRGMAEGWGDYLATVVTGRTAMGGWSSGEDRGTRRFPYDENFPVAEANFGSLPDLRGKPYAIGEIWCATLLAMHRRIGARLAVGLVLDALRDLPVNPSLIDGRDTILLALQDRLDDGAIDGPAAAEARAGIWAAFAAFGMGLAASSQGPTLAGIVTDATVPPP
ncbi:M36 family metallopeptidase [Pseudonocardia kujensis]|uniref:M36 family metallopeptidase n=1 Tax=Pseudonocardia kujensis TaxID=1128675 RepID=UPI001E5D7C5E|nr:M36 family metallopeptidase [Pseudonocardia kujensis]MCE0764116.1 M36 family metallopeptidase [Pseudonocardia kujensis]